VLTTDFRTGSYSVVDLATRNVTKDIRPGGVHSDALARSLGGRVYVVNRLNADNIQIIDLQQGYTTPANAQVSVGNGTNPQDIAFVNATKAYGSRLGRTAPSLLILNPTTLATLGELELSSLIKANDRDGSPEPAFMLVNNGLLYVVLQHLDQTATLFPPLVPGEIAVIDPGTDSIVRVIQLPFRNPLSQLHFSPTLRRILVSCVGNFGVNDGGIVVIDPTTNTVDPTISITEAALGGDITDFEIVSSTKAFAIVTDANFANSLVTFNPSAGQRLTTVLGPLDVFIPQMAINSRNELYVAINDTTTTTPGVRVFDTVTNRDLIPGPLNVGQLPPVWVLFLE
jgi:DNA-binding beta-propeller fold protein YncE